jgi:hypothetical protein
LLWTYGLLAGLASCRTVVRRGPKGRELTTDEKMIRGLVREVYGENIVGETLATKGGDSVLTIRLKNENLATLEINLSSLARKHRDEGLSLAVIKMGLRVE